MGLPSMMAMMALLMTLVGVASFYAGWRWRSIAGWATLVGVAFLLAAVIVRVGLTSIEQAVASVLLQASVAGLLLTGLLTMRNGRQIRPVHAATPTPAPIRTRMTDRGRPALGGRLLRPLVLAGGMALAVTTLLYSALDTTGTDPLMAVVTAFLALPVLWALAAWWLEWRRFPATESSLHHRVRRNQHVQRIRIVHALLGIGSAAVLYILCLTGSILTMRPALLPLEALSAPDVLAIDAGKQGSAGEDSTGHTRKRALGEFESVLIDRAIAAVHTTDTRTTTHLFIDLPTAERPHLRVRTDHAAWFANVDGTLSGQAATPWIEFVLRVHYYLLLPGAIGMPAVGIAGVMMLVLVFSGCFAQPRLLRDAFTIRRGAGRLTLVDLHNRVGLWTAPFQIAIALTGATIGLGVLLTSVLATTHHEGERSAVLAPVYGEEHPVDPAAAPLAQVAGPLQWVRHYHPEFEPTLLIIHDPATRGQRITVMARHPRHMVFGEYFNFGANGAFLGRQGLVDGAIWRQLMASFYGIHFGDWGGLPVRALYALLGLATCLTIHAGVQSYVRRRAAADGAARYVQAAWRGMAVGSPVMIVACLITARLSKAAPGVLDTLFASGLFATIILAIWRSHRRLQMASPSKPNGPKSLAFNGHHTGDGLLPAADPENPDAQSR